ncbi:MAG: T9SS type A sorting domain-containing protein [Ignavibacteria bacterium]|nr:T9SS type A sorting domain-containing protein [Ignavibacteria bacterium]
MIFRTVNGGLNWTAVPTNGLAVKALMYIWAIDSLTCFVGDGGDAAGTTGGDAIVSKTTNGGMNWVQVFNTGGTAGFFNGIVFSKSMPSFGIAESDPQAGAGQPYYVQKTTNGGVNWTLTNPPGVSGAASAQNSVMVIDNLFYGFGTNTGSSRVYITSNGGTSWFIGTLGIAGTFTSALAFNDNKLTGIASTSTSFPNIARTTNGGTTWSSVGLGGTGTTTNSALKWINGTNTCYYLGQNASMLVVYKSTNGGFNWTMMTATAPNLFHFDFVRVGTTVTGFAVAVGGSILKLSETVTGITEENTLPADYSLSQNYPNPFNPVTTIKFALPKSGKVTVQVYNMLGKEVQSVYDNVSFGAGNHEVSFDGGKLASGIYTYKLIVDGRVIDTKKMALIK